MKIKDRISYWARNHIHPDVRNQWKKMASTWAMVGAVALSGLLAIWSHFDGKLPEIVYIGVAVLGPVAVYAARSWNQRLGEDQKELDFDA